MVVVVLQACPEVLVQAGSALAKTRLWVMDLGPRHPSLRGGVPRWMTSQTLCCESIGIIEVLGVVPRFLHKLKSTFFYFFVWLDEVNQMVLATVPDSGHGTAHSLTLPKVLCIIAVPPPSSPIISNLRRVEDLDVSSLKDSTTENGERKCGGAAKPGVRFQLRRRRQPIALGSDLYPLSGQFSHGERGMSSQTLHCMLLNLVATCALHSNRDILNIMVCHRVARSQKRSVWTSQP